MTQTTIILTTKMTEYSAEKAAKKSMTVAQMIDALRHFPEDARVVVSDYDEYMYAPINVSDLHEHVEE
ncbi:hypothetical protein [Duodenibacillus massiliensis]|uniref:hypothetical protein n=1 Tax=Duodenibacillus massiliensis TaxID=1852381 RepID=UPI003078E23F